MGRWWTLGKAGSSSRSLYHWGVPLKGTEGPWPPFSFPGSQGEGFCCTTRFCHDVFSCYRPQIMGAIVHGLEPSTPKETFSSE